nr:hypothetical protein [Tanacetum cinerariifolium]
MDDFVTENQEIYYSGITSITVNGKAAYELKGRFLDDLRENVLNGTNREGAVEHIEYFLKIVDPIDVPNVNYEQTRPAVFPVSLVENTSKCLKDEALKQKSIYEKSWGNATQSDHIRGPYANVNTTYDRYLDSRNGRAGNDSDVQEEEEQHNEGQCDLFDNPAQESPVYKVKRFDMIKYSFGQEEEHVGVKEYEYDYLTRTNKNTCHSYQEIFCNIDKGWLVTRVE